jgi:hypothetical protein
LQAAGEKLSCDSFATMKRVDQAVKQSTLNSRLEGNAEAAH